MKYHSFVSGDTGSVLRVTCRNDDDSVINLSGSALKLKWVDSAGALVEKSMTIEDAANGIATYQFGADELEAEVMSFEVEITNVQGKLLRSLELLRERVREALA